MQLPRRIIVQLVPLTLLVFVLAACAGRELEKPESVVTVPPATPIESRVTVTTPVNFEPVETDEASTPIPTESLAPTETSVDMLYNGLPHGLTEAGFPYLGDPDAAVTVVVYSDFL